MGLKDIFASSMDVSKCQRVWCLFINKQRVINSFKKDYTWLIGVHLVNRGSCLEPAVARCRYSPSKGVQYRFDKSFLKKVSVSLHHTHLQLWQRKISFKTDKTGENGIGKQGVSLREICFYKEIKKEAQRYYLKDGQSDHKNGKSDEKEERGQNWALGAKKK